MPSKDSALSALQRIRDILDNIDAIRTFTADMDFARFSSDRLVCYGVTRALEIISEASRHLPAEVKGRQHSIEWRSIAAAGNVHRHQYDGNDEMFVWDVVIHDLEPLKQAMLEEELARLQAEKTLSVRKE